MRQQERESGRRGFDTRRMTMLADALIEDYSSTERTSTPYSPQSGAISCSAAHNFYYGRNHLARRGYSTQNPPVTTIASHDVSRASWGRFGRRMYPLLITPGVLMSRRHYYSVFTFKSHESRLFLPLRPRLCANSSCSSSKRWPCRNYLPKDTVRDLMGLKLN